MDDMKTLGIKSISQRQLVIQIDFLNTSYPLSIISRSIIFTLQTVLCNKLKYILKKQYTDLHEVL